MTMLICISSGQLHTWSLMSPRDQGPTYSFSAAPLPQRQRGPVQLAGPLGALLPGRSNTAWETPDTNPKLTITSGQ
jgi:hypothetical protein